MDTSEIRELNSTLGEIENHIEDVRAVLRRDPNWMAAVAPPRVGKKRGGKKRFPGTPSSAEDPSASLSKKVGKKRKKDKDNRPKHSHKTKSRRLRPFVLIYPSKRTSKQIGKKYREVPTGQKWVHAGYSVFVQKKVYDNFELVRRALSRRISKLYTTERVNWND